jgi:tRNA pseudouridine38-40 synthase
VAIIEPVLIPEDGFSRIKIELAYDGSNFNGWARQKDDPFYRRGKIRTVQAEMESALTLLAHQNCQTIVAGRTDAGVHATAQVIHSDIPLNQYTDLAGDGKLEASNWDYRLNRILPGDIRVKKVELAPAYFHARFSALSRTYKYLIADRNQFIYPLERFDVAPWYRELDTEKMDQLAKRFVGEFDFAAYSKFRPESSTIRRVLNFAVWRNERGFVEAQISADAFCYNMVRSLIGALVAVGEGRFGPEWAIDILNSKVRPSDSYVFPANGLTLSKVEYPPDSQLKARSDQTIGRRDEE